ncbi:MULTISPECIES: tyrosine-type recombinase/integrase [unclassified Francisella]|uniref:tyrosine-type recombinase/integrase n=1 Tax=unclassified Francisella TaxID=2610885 RepID=UPI002E378710|nr:MULTISPECIES: integrase arm-type DNA-binding domain-containing protein [unclassified Francisella]MED7818426.1 integrase arm-type DNA-binding domain-containing protein [Francisella sp. 19S2-4]MED7829319.1 integrase arm-type DNA-binding domain-containing protein [Francisella sp. 19S2-10]
MLTTTKIDKIKTKKTEQRIIDALGLYLRVDKYGNKTWQYRYVFNEKRKWLGIGPYPAISIDDARKIRMELKELLDTGEDISYRSKAKTVIYVKDLVLEYIEFQRRNSSSEDFIKKITNISKNHVIPVIGNRNIKTIKRQDCLDVLQPLADKGATRNKVLSILKGVCILAIHHQIIEHNPTIDISISLPKYRAEAMPHISPLHDKELLRELFLNISNYTRGNVVSRLALKLLPYLVLRPAELVSLEWKFYDSENARITIPAQLMKMRKNHIVCLSSQAKEIIEELKELNLGSKYIFPSFYRNNNHINYESLSKAIRTMGYNGIEKPKQTLHGFRHIYSTIVHELQDKYSFSSLAIELVLAHTDTNKSRASYNFSEKLGERTKIMQIYADWIDNLKSSGE